MLGVVIISVFHYLGHEVEYFWRVFVQYFLQAAAKQGSRFRTSASSWLQNMAAVGWTWRSRSQRGSLLPRYITSIEEQYHSITSVQWPLYSYTWFQLLILKKIYWKANCWLKHKINVTSRIVGCYHQFHNAFMIVMIHFLHMSKFETS